MTDFLGIKNREGKLIEKYKKAIEGKSNPERRKIEVSLFKPESLTPYVGPKVNRGPLGKRTVKFIFPSNDDVELLSKYIKVNQFVELNSYDVGMLMRFINLLDEGTLRYDAGEKQIIFIDDRGEEFPL